MFKSRLEALSDGIFAIVFTLLVIEIKVPEHLEDRTAGGLWSILVGLAPLFLAYLVSFVVLTMYWTSHSFLFSKLTKNANRTMMYLNLIFLCLIALVPFSAHLIGRYSDINLAVIIYGIHILVISAMSNVIFYYAIFSNEIETAHNSRRIIKQAAIRRVTTLAFTSIGILSAMFVSSNLAFVLYMFPILFNIVPGSLDFVEKTFKFSLD
jgi:uncharacterized membrane protein